MGDIIPMRKGSKNVRWDLIEDLYRGYMVGLCGEDQQEWLEQHNSLTASEQGALEWKMERDCRVVGQLLEALKNQGASCIADMSADPGPEVA